MLKQLKIKKDLTWICNDLIKIFKIKLKFKINNIIKRCTLTLKYCLKAINWS